MNSQILYIDHYNNLSPLTTAYHATASKCLTSSLINRDVTNLDKHSGNQKSSSLVEFDSGYCPQCLTFITSEHRGFCERCRACPDCDCVLSLSLEKEDDGKFLCMYQCRYCRWTSKECGMTLSTTDVIPSTELVAKFGEVVAQVENRVLGERNNLIQNQIRDLKAKASDIESEKRRRARTGYIPPSKGTSSSSGPAWSIEALTNSLGEKKSAAEVGTRITIPDSQSSYRDQSTIPKKVPIRVRKVRRCRAELAAGRPGILVKPKVNPLEGDSSLRSGHGQWWKKDSSAIHVIPNVKIVEFFRIDGGYLLLLKIKNPTLGMIRMELVVDPDTESDSLALKQILLDPLRTFYVNASKCCKPNKRITTSKFTIDAAEDAFLELGRDMYMNDPMPDLVEWREGTTQIVDDAMSLQVIRTLKDSAWVGVTMASNISIDDEEEYLVSPRIGLSLEVGNGSWESSLITPSREGSSDYVTFDFVAVWKKKF